MDDGLFEAPEPQPINVGDRIILRTVWGGEEKGRVEALGHDSDGWPTVTVSTLRGYRATVGRASVSPDMEERPSLP